MNYPYPPSFPSFRPSADHPDGLFAELHEVQAALAVVEYHVKLLRANSATEDMPFCAHLAYAAHEAVHEAGRSIDRIAEILRIEVAGTLTAGAE